MISVAGVQISAMLKYGRKERSRKMIKLFKYVLIALACPLVLPMVEQQESEGE